jgi:hypothetical protein
MEDIAGQDRCMVGGFDQPLQHRVRVDCEHAGHRTDARPFGQGAHGPHHQLGCDARAMQGRAMHFEKIGPAGHTLQLPPPSTAGMTVGADIATPDPPVIVTTWTGAELVLSIYLSRASPYGDNRQRGSRGSLGLLLYPVLAGGTGWLIGKPWKRLVRL